MQDGLKEHASALDSLGYLMGILINRCTLTSQLHQPDNLF